MLPLNGWFTVTSIPSGAQVLHNLAAVGNDVRFGGREVVVHRDRIAVVNVEKNNVLASAPLVSRQKVVHAEQLDDLAFQPEVGGRTGVGVIALSIAACCSWLIAFTPESVSMSKRRPCSSAGTC